MSGVLEGTAVIVTGAAHGLGRAYALAAAEAGAGVIVGDLRAEGVHETVDLISTAGGTAVGVVGDVVQPETAQSFVDTCLATFGRLDGLVNNAGVIFPGSSLDLSARDVRLLVDVNVTGSILCGVAAARAMRDAGTPGSIVNVSSGALQGLDDLALYGATKGATASLTYGWALEWERYGIRCNAIAPLAHTAMSDQMNIPDEHKGPDPALIAPALLHLLSARSAPLTGQILRFDGKRLGLVTPSHLTIVTERPTWSPEDVAEALAGVLAPGVAPVGLMNSPRPQWVVSD
ncbi:SDR family NAD(P)-dependent oxidoreductase [Microcella pacifica]|uniref:SDR family oxidoreductase n=1 Tax=Microcella pacifica TaxID=2591847 RepID=A0A9E5JNV1_9MICO|nr:SDR family oxidoreductase [Microcella pacifica]NHF62152.1 SDR family oxidoreductase [Microcella pacifica]